MKFSVNGNQDPQAQTAEEESADDVAGPVHAEVDAGGTDGKDEENQCELERASKPVRNIGECRLTARCFQEVDCGPEKDCREDCMSAGKGVASLLNQRQGRVWSGAGCQLFQPEIDRRSEGSGQQQQGVGTPTPYELADRQHHGRHDHEACMTPEQPSKKDGGFVEPCMVQPLKMLQGPLVAGKCSVVARQGKQTRHDSHSDKEWHRACKHPRCYNPGMVHDIAIDGPAASGKTVVGRRLAQRLGWRFLDTGVMYRAITWLALERGVSPEDPFDLGLLAVDNPIRLADGVSSDDVSRPVETGGVLLGPELYESRVDNNVSNVSKHTTVRTALVEQQREIAALAASVSGIVMIGRDIGTVVLPNAGLKVYLTASAEKRAERRWREMQGRGLEIELATVRDEIDSRDVIDSSRIDSPLRPSDDAWILDGSDLTIDEAVTAIYERALAS